MTPETNNLFQQYYRVVLGEGDNMTTGLASSFIGTTEATTSKNRIYATHQLLLRSMRIDHITKEVLPGKIREEIRVNTGRDLRKEENSISTIPL